jgi:hypothetical protein
VCVYACMNACMYASMYIRIVGITAELTFDPWYASLQRPLIR